MGEKINYLLQKLNGSHSEDKISERIDGLLKSMSLINKYVPLEGATVVEIGTGWAPVCSMLFYLMGVKTCYTYDHVPHVRFNFVEMLIGSVENQLDDISKSTSIPLSILEKRLLHLKNSSNLNDILNNANIVYNAPGDASMTGLKDGCIDLVYSHGVLEHVPENLIYDFMIESKRILKSSGIAYHLIGLHDHCANFDRNVTKVNFLKYPEFIWAFIANNNIFFHNRLREKQFLDIFKECGAEVLWLENRTDPSDIGYLKSVNIDKYFNGMSYEELAVYQTELIISFYNEHNSAVS